MSECSQSRNFHENNIDLAKSGLESGAWIDGYVFQNKEENGSLPLQKIRVLHFVRAVYHTKIHVFPHPGYYNIKCRSQNAEKVMHINERLLDQSAILFNYVPFEKGNFSERKEFAPRGSEFFPLMEIPYGMENTLTKLDDLL